MAEYFWGIDVGGTNVKVGLVGSNGRAVASGSLATQIERGPEAMVERIAATCLKLEDEAGVLSDEIKGLGVGSPGPISVKEGKIISAANLEGFDDFSLRGGLSRLLDRPAVYDNDVNLICWGEFWQGAGREVSDMVMFAVGTGIGGGIVCQGELVRGSEGNAAELGHMILVQGGRQCGCGQKGCLEAYASANQTAARAMEALDAGRPSSLSGVRERKMEITSKDVFDEAQAGDALALEIVDGTAEALALASVNMRHITEPQAVVLGGGMVKAGEILMRPLRRFYEEQMWHLKAEPMAIVAAELGDNAGVVGAAGLALDAYQKGELWAVGT